MPEVSFYRKYRPQNFNNLVGQDHIRSTILNALLEGHPAHAYLFCGPRGTGKTSTARLVAKALNCLKLDEHGEPCDECDLCTTIRDGTLIDLVEIDAASNRGIDEIRELKDKINFAPTRAKNKVYIIDEVHMLTKEAFNALLKTLEEPPEHVYFILATTEAHKVPETIISRCQRFDFKRISQKTLVTRLMYIAQLENIEVEPDAVDAIARTSEGGLRDAIGLLEQLTIDGKLTFERVRDVLGISGNSAFEALFGHLQGKNMQLALLEIHNLYAEGIDLVQFTKDFLEFLREKLMEATEADNLEEIRDLIRIINHFQGAYDKLKTATIPQLPLEIAILEASLAPFPHQPVVDTAPQRNQERAPEKTENTVQTITNEPRVHSAIKKTISEQEASVEYEKIPLTISHVKENWPRVIERIKTPFVKQSLKEGQPILVENDQITIEFKSNFHKEKIDSAENKLEIENVIRDIFEKPAKINYSVRKVELSSSGSAVNETNPEDSENKQNDPPSGLTKAALDMFGGELVNDEK